jgi:hypothetical protein
VKTPLALLATAAVVGFVAFTVVACAGGSTPQTTANTSYTECLRNEGIDIPTANPRGTAFPSGRPTNFPSARPSGRPGGGGNGGFGNTPPSGVDPQKWQAALQKCASLRPSGNPSRGPRGDGRATAYTNCLADHGVTGQLPPSDPKLAEAAQACAVLSPSPSPR